MTKSQRAIAVVTLAILALFFHKQFCWWAVGEYHQVLVKQYGGGRIPDESRLVLSFGPMAGVYARTLRSQDLDATLGVAVPVALTGWAFFLLAARSGRKDQGGNVGGQPV
jgi:hypothetical protein